MTLTLTSSAEAELMRIWRDSPTALGFRIAVEAGGCAGLTYKLSLISESNPAEERIVVGGIPFFIHPAHQILIDGLRIDYPQGLEARGFVFHNPQARTTCGCGTSFSV
ncbi:MAG: iron-sulfur cluster assembly accessory protein [Bacteroidia bacterium]